MTWNPITEVEMATARAVVTWIRTARAAGYGGPDWLPSDADISKSALLERLRSGKEPLDEPPPLGMSCPWYALVEDAGPHYVFDVWEASNRDPFYGPDVICVLQSPYRIVEKLGIKEFIVRDGNRDTSFRFRLTYNPTWVHPAGRITGGWFIGRDQSRELPSAEK